MKGSRRLVAGLTTLAAATAMGGEARAQTYSFSFNGPGIGGSVVLTYGAARDARYSNAYRITGISGTFTDTNNGLNIVNVPIGSLVPTTRATPDSTNLLAPNEFSRFAVASGLDGPAPSVSYTNLLWPGGSPQTATDYPFSGGFLDIYGLLFEIGGGRVVNLWSDGNLDFGPVTYGAAVVTSERALDYTFAGVTATVTPEPGSLWLLVAGGGGLVGLLTLRRRATRTT